MNKFSFEFASDYTPEQVWSALNTPLPEDISRRMYYGLAIDYEGLDENRRIRTGTRQVCNLDTGKLSIVSSIIPNFPDKIAVSVTELTDEFRQDVFDPGQFVEGTLNRRVREKSGKGILVAEGELAISGAVAERWSSFLGDADSTAVYYGVQKPNEEMVVRISEILKL